MQTAKNYLLAYTANDKHIVNRKKLCPYANDNQVYLQLLHIVHVELPVSLCHRPVCIVCYRTGLGTFYGFSLFVMYDFSTEMCETDFFVIALVRRTSKNFWWRTCFFM